PARWPAESIRGPEGSRSRLEPAEKQHVHTASNRRANTLRHGLEQFSPVRTSSRRAPVGIGPPVHSTILFRTRRHLDNFGQPASRRRLAHSPKARPPGVAQTILALLSAPVTLLWPGRGSEPGWDARRFRPAVCRVSRGRRRSPCAPGGQG